MNTVGSTGNDEKSDLFQSTRDGRALLREADSKMWGPVPAKCERFDWFRLGSSRGEVRPQVKNVAVILWPRGTHPGKEFKKKKKNERERIPGSI